MTTEKKSCAQCKAPLLPNFRRHRVEVGELAEEEFCSEKCASARIVDWAAGKVRKTDPRFDLEPGTYKLTADVANPKPDRRVKNDWRDLVTIPAGAIFVVRVFGNDERALSRVGEWNHQDLRLPSDGLRGELLNALAPHLERIPETPQTLLQRLGWENQYSVILDELIEAGKITLADVETALNVWLSRPD